MKHCHFISCLLCKCIPRSAVVVCAWGDKGAAATDSSRKASNFLQYNKLNQGLTQMKCGKSTKKAGFSKHL